MQNTIVQSSIKGQVHVIEFFEMQVHVSHVILYMVYFQYMTF
jgi:hypothetical protein